MIVWLRNNWRLALLNLLGAGVMIDLWAIRAGLYQPDVIFVSNPFFEGSGRWALRFLLISLSMTPLNTLFGWRSALKLRKTAGLWVFAFGVIHFLAFTNFRLDQFGWLVAEWNQAFIYMGIAGLSVLTLMAITSNRWAMRWLGKGWKRLHRLVYAAGLLLTLHAVIGYSSGKKLFLDPQGVRELHLYVALMGVVLALRLPFIRHLVRRLKPRRRTSIPITPIAPIPDQWDDVSENPITIAVSNEDSSTLKEDLHEFVL